MPNYNAYFVDPGESIKTGLGAINTALANYAPLQLNSLRLQEAQLRAKQDEELRSRLAAAKGQTQYQQPAPQPMSPRSLASVSGMGVQGSPLMQQSQPLPATGPTVGSTNQYTPPDLAAITAQTRLEQGRPEEAKQVIDLDDALMKMRFQAEQGGGDRMAYLKKQQQFEQGKEMIKTLAPIAKVPATRKIAERLLAGYKQQQPDNPIIQQMTLDDFSVTQNDELVVRLTDPETKQLIGYNVYDPESGKFTFHKDEPTKPLVVAPGSTVLGPDNQPVFTADPKAEYKSRTRNVGNTEVFEESQDGGKTWKQVGEPAPRYKPPGGGTTIMQSTFVDPATGNPLIFDKATGSYKVATISGGGGVTPKPSAMTPEAAAKTQLVEQGLTYIPTIRGALFDQNGNVDRVLVGNIATRMPFTEGRKISTYILDAVEAKLRAESGAAVPEPEVKRAAKRFIPQVADNDATIKAKIDNLEAFLKGTADKINRGRQQDKKPGGKKADPLGIL